MLYTGQINEFLRLDEVNSSNCHLLKETISEGLSVIWTLDELIIKLDGAERHFKANDILFLTEFHTIEILKIQSVKLVRFNRAFYCISDHDNEVGCKGILFFGASHLPKITIPYTELEKFETLYKLFNKYGNKSPLQIIQDRKALEARRWR